MSNSWALDTVVAYFRDDEEIAQALTDEEFGTLFNPDLALSKLIREALKYQGFDPRVVLKQVIKNRKAYEARKAGPLEWDLSNTSEDFKKRDNSKKDNIFTNNESLARDMLFLIRMFLTRNNHISKIVLKSRDGLSDILEMLKEKYDINDKIRKSGTQLGSTDITLPRLAGVFPTVAVRLFHEKSVKEIVPLSSLPGIIQDDLSGLTEVSHALVCPFLPSLQPKKLVEKINLHPIMMYVAVRLDDVIHKKEKNITSLDSLMSYYKAGYDSAVTPEASRKDVLKKLGLVAASQDILKPAVQRLASACLEELKVMRTDDPHHGTLIDAVTSGKFE